MNVVSMICVLIRLNSRRNLSEPVWIAKDESGTDLLDCDSMFPNSMTVDDKSDKSIDSLAIGRS